MFFLGDLVKVTDDDYIVDYTHTQPFDEKDGLGKTEEELAVIGVLVDEVPQPIPQPNKLPVLHVNPANKQLWYTYKDERKTPDQLRDEKIAQLEAENALMKAALDDLILNSGGGL